MFQFANTKEFITHLLDVHRNKVVKYKCSFCEFETETQKTLNTHMVNYHDIIIAMNGLAENQNNIGRKFDNFKDEIMSALRRIIEDNIILKQELFILRQNQAAKKPGPNIENNVPK